MKKNRLKSILSTFILLSVKRIFSLTQPYVLVHSYLVFEKFLDCISRKIKHLLNDKAKPEVHDSRLSL